MHDQILNELSSSHLAPATFIAAITFMVLAICILIYPPKTHRYFWQYLAGLTIGCTLYLCIVSIYAYQRQEISQEQYTQLRSDLQANPEYAPLIAEALRSGRITNIQFDELHYAFINVIQSREKELLAEKVSSILQISPSSK